MKVALIQQAKSADVAANKEELAKSIAEAATRGAQLVVLQELHNSLYFCQVESTDNFDLAEPIPGRILWSYRKRKQCGACDIALRTTCTRPVS